LTNIEAMKQAADQLKIGLAYPGMRFYHDNIRAALTALRTAIAEAEKLEPVATVMTWHKNGDQHAELGDWELGLFKLPDGEHTLYTASPAAQLEQKQDSTCNKTLRAEGKGYPRTCMKCGKGPCIADRVQPEQPEQEPVAWDGYNLDDMCEAFDRVIEEHHQRKNPFHDPVNKDAMIALRVLRGFVPYMKLYTTPPAAQRQPLTEEEIEAVWKVAMFEDNGRHARLDNQPFVHFARAIEAAHGIGGKP
jgi:hypothetical protein